MKKVDFRILSDKRCKICGRKLKQNLVNRKPDADFCYKDYMQQIRVNPKYIKA